MAEAGWYDDPNDKRWMRWWDGSQWTEHRQERPPDNPKKARKDLENTITRSILGVLLLIALIWFVWAIGEESRNARDNFQDRFPDASQEITEMMHD